MSEDGAGHSSAIVPRRPRGWLAGLLAFLATGTGHVYAGRTRRGAAWLLAALLVPCALFSVLPHVPLDAGTLVVAAGAFSLAFEVASIADAVRTARRSPPRSGRAWRRGLAVLVALVVSISVSWAFGLFVGPRLASVYRIPGPSMAPTLLGENSREHPGTPGDRILVDKLAYWFHGPERDDVVVFRYPLDWNREFVKRVAVLPGETFRIERGDVWVGKPAAEGSSPTLHPARKRRSVREQLYTPIYPPAPSRAGRSPSDWWASDGGTAHWQIPEHGTLVYDGGASPDTRSSRRYAFPIRDTDRADAEPGSGSMYTFVPDVRVRCRVTADALAEVELEWKPSDGRRHVLRIASEGRAPSAAVATATTKTLPVWLVPGTPVDVELESVDGDLHAWIGGDEVAVIADEIPVEKAVALQESTDPPAAALTLSASGGRVVFDHVRVDHDLYYTNYREDGLYLPAAGQTVTLGDGDYFVLGDATRQSSDSRRWKAAVVTLKDASTITYDPTERPRSLTVGNRSLEEVTDVDGVLRRWDVADEAESPGVRPMPFVKRERIVGRAWLAFVLAPLDEIAARLRIVR